jgi:hypothetical protein
VIRADVRVQAGFNAEVNERLELSTVEETVTVTGESPIIDTRSNTLGTNFGKELLEAIPSARDPWVILEQTPGMVMSVQNVGGNASGQQASFGAHGSTSNQQWNLDGATITDMASSSSPAISISIRSKKSRSRPRAATRRRKPAASRSTS